MEKACTYGLIFALGTRVRRRGIAHPATRILLVENNPADARLIEIYLEESGLGIWDVHWVRTLEDAMCRLDESEYSIILLDLYLPDGEGLDLIRHIQGEHPSQNIIVLIGQDERIIGLDAIRAGASDYLVKGDYDESSLARILRFSLDRHHMVRRLEETQAVAGIGTWEYWPERKDLRVSPHLPVLVGLGPSQQLPQPVLTLLERIHRIVLSGRRVRHDTSLELEPGARRYYHVICGEYRNADGEPFLQGIMQDITERHLAEELRKSRDLAQRSAELKEQFITGISHEMRTPISAIIGLSDLLLTESLSADQHEMVKSIRDTSNILLGIVNDILDFREMQFGKIRFRNEPFSLIVLCSNIEQILTARLQDQGLVWHMTLDPNIPSSLTGDKLRLSQILLNLIGNAIKFTPAGSIHLDVKALEITAKTATIELTVRDTGIGIEPDHLPHIFEDYNRGRNQFIQLEGSGLGLAITRQLVGQQGGSIDVESTPGEGTTFRVTLPFGIATQVKKHARNGRARHVSDEGYQGAILVVEDHRLNQVVALKTLEKKWPAASIFLAENGQAALQILNKSPIDIILMDLYMPVMDGYTAARVIRCHPKEHIRHIPIIAMTANAFASNDDTMKQCGFNTFILKPFDPEQLFSAILHFTTAPTLNP